MTLKDSIKGYKKEAIYDRYTRIIKKFKEYDKISANKMIEEIVKLYNDYNNIINICITRELKYLKLLLSLDLEKESLKEKPKYLESK